MQKNHVFTATVADTVITATFTDLAENAHGSVLVEAGDTVVFVTATMSPQEAAQDYFPLSVEFEERFYSVGAILGSRFVRREGRPSQEATLNARVIDRTIRPLFPKGFHNETQVIATVLAFGTYNPDVLAVIGASLALGVSAIPWNGPVSAVRLSRSNGEWRAFTPFEEMKDPSDDILICGKDGIITMIEMEGREVPEDAVIAACDAALAFIKPLQQFQQDIIAKIGREKIPFSEAPLPAELRQEFETLRPDLRAATFSSASDLSSVRDRWDQILVAHGCDSSAKRIALSSFEDAVDTLIHTEAVVHNRRADGRDADTLRPLRAQAGGISPRLHGSGVFYRGGTHVFTALTLGGPGDALALNTVEDPDANERFMHHYNFPPFSSGEVGRIGSPKRREIGHGALAEKALRPVLPPKENFPYTMRLVSECFSSNGSTSMGSVCASTLALMDGGVPITAPVAGIALGLMKHDGSHVVLTDIQGPEDHHGDMDFKVAGTRNGITAIQMDVKIEGITPAILATALEKGRVARLAILDTLVAEIPDPRPSLSPHAPHIGTISIHPDSIGLVIGTGGKTINKIREETGVESIDIEDDGTVSVSGDKQSVASAVQTIEDMTRVFEVGDTADAKITTITEFGAFAELSPGKDGLIHVSEFAPSRVDSAESVVSPGDVVPVVVKEIKPDGRVSLSIKERDPAFFDAVLQSLPDRRERRGDRGPASRSRRDGRPSQRRGGPRRR